MKIAEFKEGRLTPSPGCTMEQVRRVSQMVHAHCEERRAADGASAGTARLSIALISWKCKFA